jgi:hypothetical protein
MSDGLSFNRTASLKSFASGSGIGAPFLQKLSFDLLVLF